MTVSNDVKNYLQFWTMFGLTQIKKSPTRIACSSTTLIDHMLASPFERIPQEDVTNLCLSKGGVNYLELCTKSQIRFT